MGLSQPDVSRLGRGDFREYSLERLFRLLNALGRDIDIVIRQPRSADGALRFHPMSPVSGNPKGDVTLVELFDYQCGYCKRSLQPVMDLLEADGQLRIVWKEFPILGSVSRSAARAGMAAAAGLDVRRLRRDMRDPAIDDYLDDTIRLARTLGIGGTPAYRSSRPRRPASAGAAAPTPSPCRRAWARQRRTATADPPHRAGPARPAGSSR